MVPDQSSVCDHHECATVFTCSHLLIIKMPASSGATHLFNRFSAYEEKYMNKKGEKNQP